MESDLTNVKRDTRYGDKLRDICDATALTEFKDIFDALHNPRYYPYITPQGHTEDPRREIRLSLTEADRLHLDIGNKDKPIHYINRGIEDQAHQCASEIAALEDKYKMQFLGFRSVDLNKGLFAIYYLDTKGAAKMGLFSVKDCPNYSGINVNKERYRWIDLAYAIHPDLPKVVAHYFEASK